MAPLPVGMHDFADPAARRTGVVHDVWAAVPDQDGVVVDALSGGHCQTKHLDDLAALAALAALALSENTAV